MPVVKTIILTVLLTLLQLMPLETLLFFVMALSKII